MSSPFTALDVVLIGIAFLSAILAMFRGFTREVLSILSWVVAAGAALWAYPLMKDRVRELIQPEPLADGVLIIGTFIIVLIAVSLITVRITDLILDSQIGAIDRTLGFLFGLARGVILVVVAFLFFSWLVPERQQPDWVRNAQTAPFMISTGELLLSYLPEDPAEMIEYLPDTLKSYINKLLGEDDDGGDAPAQTPTSAPADERQSRALIRPGGGSGNPAMSRPASGAT
ncbi:Colicin V production protein [hydrothermal vent metagenome]|uniref:Colicin V production protein n=1 Tax=hydrothermal vent metagenome TaxID=652676 RepID=A0A3B0TCD4_9ZZZZ